MDGVRIGTVSDTKLDSIKSELEASRLSAIAPIESQKARRKEQFENDNRIINAELVAKRDQLAHSERLLSNQRARIRKVLLVWFVGIVFILITGIYIMESRKQGSPPILIVIVVVSAFFIDPIAYAKGKPANTEKAIKSYRSEISQMEAKKVSLRQAYEQDISKFSQAISNVNKDFALDNPKNVSGNTG